MAKQNALGRGLGELFRPTEASEPADTASGAVKTEPAQQPTRALEDGSRYLELPITLINPNSRQPRQVFDQEALDELSDSIKEVGLLQPIVVRPAGESYELIMGERRLRAATQAGLTEIPAIVRGTDDTDMLRDALLENLHRAQLNPLEEAAAYQQLLDDFGCTQEELSTRIKRSRPQISNTLRLMRLPAPVQRRVAAGVLSAGHARALLGLPDALEQERLAQRIVAEGLSVRSTEELVALHGSERPERRRRTPRPPSERALQVQEELTDHFDTKVKVSMGRNKGRIVIEFGDQEDLGRVLRIIDPSL
ncbi:ParB/RepB/Spo0J family partition protein [Aestuariimicrobium sp. Y1814]|uniref:ParB/RepB/Spo0J family partition protein n=1 Tax=Aestuariimicrobium sp. Y1814 TaxID=3418742 RepID=UPI003DA715BB